MAISIYNIGRQVICDSCNADGETLMGGGIIGDSAYCQKCLERMIRRGVTPDRLFSCEFTFADQVRDYRFEVTGRSEGFITLLTGEDADEFMGLNDG